MTNRPETFIYSAENVPIGGNVGDILTKVGAPNYYTAWRAHTLEDSGVTAGTYNNSATANQPFTIDSKGRITATGSLVTITPAFSSITSKPTTLAGYGITDAATSTHVHGNISNGGAIGTTANLPIITTTSGLLTTGTFGTTINTFCQGNDTRLSNTRLTTNSLTFNSGGAGAASGTTFNGSAAVTVSYNTLGAQPLDATLTALAGVTTAANTFIYATGVDTFSTSTVTTYIRTLLAATDAAASRTTLGLGTIATQDSDNVSITGGSIDGITFDDGTY